jgi:hypothetical protein
MMKLVNIEKDETIIESNSISQFYFRLNKHIQDKVLSGCDTEEDVFDKKFEFCRTHRVVSSDKFSYRVTTWLRNNKG